MIELFVCVCHHRFPSPWKKKLRLEYDTLYLLVASKPGVWSNQCFLNDRYGISDWKQNLNFGSLGLQALSSLPNLWKRPSQGLSQPSFKDNGIFEVTVSYKWFWLTPTRGWSPVLSLGYTNTVDAWQGGKYTEWTWSTEPPHSAAAGEEEGPEAGK